MFKHIGSAIFELMGSLGCIVIHPACFVNCAVRIPLFNFIARGFEGMLFRENI